MAEKEAPLSNAERQKRYRERLKQDPDRYEELRKKHLERVKKNKVKIKNQNEFQKQKSRSKWREYSARYYEKTKKKSDASSTEVENTNINIKKIKNKMVRLQKELKISKEALTLSVRKQNTMRKQIYRLKQKKYEQDNQEKTNEEQEPALPSEFDVLSESLRSVYKESNRKDKNVIKKIIKNSTTARYKMITKLTKAVGLKGKIRSNISKAAKRKLLILQIHNFYLRDDVSQATAGKKQCRTKDKIKTQIRYLTDTMRNLYAIYKKEGGKASYTTLTRHRPFYVLSPKIYDRETCACIRHENIKFKIAKLQKLGFLKTNKATDILKQISCSLESKTCMYGECQICATKKIEIINTADDITISWLQWCLKKVPYKKKNKDGSDTEAVTKKFCKNIMTDNLSNMLQKFFEEAANFKKHYYNMIHQQKAFRQCVDGVTENEAVVIIDFSENYLCKYNCEIQGMHFGSSRNQITLHTGVAYLKNELPEPFCSISPNNEHSPLTIWSHLQPVLNNIKYQHPEIDTLHVFSDGPTTQYRQKGNFALFDKFTKQFGFVHATWSFFEASHGKNAADGIGGVLKRTLDRHVGYKIDISNAVDAFKVLKQSTTITLYYVSDRDIQIIKELNPISHLSPVSGTMTIHQIITTEEPGIIKHRKVSCFCGEKRGSCSCYDPKEHCLIKQIKETNDIQKIAKIKTDVDKKKRIEVKDGPISIIRKQANIMSIKPSSSSGHVKQESKPKLRSLKRKAAKKGKENKKRRTILDISSTDTDEDEVVYAESDDSPYQEESDLELSGSVNNKKKITVLSEIRLNPDNRRYINLKSSGPSNLHKTKVNHQLSDEMHQMSSDDDNIFFFQ